MPGAVVVGGVSRHEHAEAGGQDRLLADGHLLYFPDKEALLGELVEREFMKFRRGFDQAGQPGSDPIERLRKMGMIYVDFGLEQPAAYKFLFMNTQIEQFPKIGLIEQGNPAQDCYAYLRATVIEGLAAGRFRPELAIRIRSPNCSSPVRMVSCRSFGAAARIPGCRGSRCRTRPAR